MPKPVYLDCAATTPIEPRVREEVLRFLDEDFGNAGSRTHEWGRRAKSAVESARARVAAVVGATRGEVIFTSGATESNNLAILGLVEFADRTRRKHIVTTEIEHNAVLEPIRHLAAHGFDVTFVPPDASGAVSASAIASAVRDDTALISVMHVNNETGVLQPVEEIAGALESHAAYFHVDAAQGFGKDLAPLRNKRIDLISVSGHKIHAPKGIGALIARKRGKEAVPLSPLLHGGGQERGLRPGTLPVHLIAGLGKAAELAIEESDFRAATCRNFRRKLLAGLAPLDPIINGALDQSLPNVINLSIPGVDADTAMEAWADLAAISDGAACTSADYSCSHVLSAMGLSEARKQGAIRISWCHFSEMPDLPRMVEQLARVRTPAV
jgi:cysteine desulfurase